MFARLLTCSLLLNTLATTSADDTWNSPNLSPLMEIVKKIMTLFEGQGQLNFQQILMTLFSGATHIRLTEDSSFTAMDENGIKEWGESDILKLGFKPRHSKTEFLGASQRDCFSDFHRLIENVTENPWVFQFLDAFGKPGPSLLKGRIKFVGNYKQCRSAKAPPLPGEVNSGYSGNYCVVNLSIKNLTGVIVQLAKIQIGTCMPDSCTESDITDIVDLGLTMFNLSSIFVAEPTECRTDKREFTGATYASIVILSVILTLMVSGSLFDLLVIGRPKWTTNHQREELIQSDTEKMFPSQSGHHKTKNEAKIFETDISGRPFKKTHSNGQFVCDSQYTEKTPIIGEVKGKGGVHLSLKGEKAFANQAEPTMSFRDYLGQILLSFSVFRNGSKILDTSQTSDSLTVIHGIRFLSISWVVLGHLHQNALLNTLNISEKALAVMKEGQYDVITNAFFSVDSFLTISGFLVAYITTKMYKQNPKFNWGLFYIHRFWRLTPTYMLTLLVILGLLRFMGSGALWPTVALDQHSCEANWWTNLLYVNNFFKVDKPCLLHSWYLAVDSQFYILSPLILLPFFWKFRAGMLVCGIVLFASWLTTGVLSTYYRWASSLVRLDINSFDKMDHYFFFNYISPYCRIGPYIIGLMSGHLLAVRQGQVRMNKITVWIGWVVSIACGLAVVYGIHGDISAENKSSVAVSALYNALAKSAWGACVSWVIIACSSGYGGPVTVLLSWSPFIVLSRLTFMTYLIHPYVIYIFFNSQETLYASSYIMDIISYLGILWLTNMSSFVLMLALESPVIALEKVIFRIKRPLKQSRKSLLFD
nr:nose resistant to fluoxetine protein 6-like; partial [Biomphalaria glabrata]